MSKEQSHELARAIVEWALAKKAEDVVVLDVSELSDVTDYFVLLSGSSQSQVQTIAEAILDAAVKWGEKPLHVEGRELGSWILIDFFDVVAHVMQPRTRNYYSLERLWGDAPLTRFDEEGASQ
jgi:ribosome-associated protein